MTTEERAILDGIGRELRRLFPVPREAPAAGAYPAAIGRPLAALDGAGRTIEAAGFAPARGRIGCDRTD